MRNKKNDKVIVETEFGKKEEEWPLTNKNSKMLVSEEYSEYIGNANGGFWTDDRNLIEIKPNFSSKSAEGIIRNKEETKKMVHKIKAWRISQIKEAQERIKNIENCIKDIDDVLKQMGE